jgi:hypothetical protein
MFVVCACGRSGFGPEIDADVQVDATAGDGNIVDPIDAPAGSTVTTFGETPTANVKNVTSDTYITSEIPQNAYNYGAWPSVSVEGSQKKALVRFDVSSLPPGTQLVAARLHFRATYLESSTTVAIAPILEQWTEGTQSGVAGVANNTQRTATQNWTTLGAGSPGSSGAMLASVQVTAVGTIGVDLPVATVQGWIDAPGSNFGVVLSATGGGGDLRVSSSNASTASECPELVLTYFP